MWPFESVAIDKSQQSLNASENGFRIVLWTREIGNGTTWAKLLSNCENGFGSGFRLSWMISPLPQNKRRWFNQVQWVQPYYNCAGPCFSRAHTISWTFATYRLQLIVLTLFRTSLCVVFLPGPKNLELSWFCGTLKPSNPGTLLLGCKAMQRWVNFSLSMQWVNEVGQRVCHFRSHAAFQAWMVTRGKESGSINCVRSNMIQQSIVKERWEASW